MATVETHGGEFSTESPGYYRIRSDNRGCKIKLLFTPNDLVDCPKIGLVQTATSNKGGSDYYVGSTERKAEQEDRSLSSDEEQHQGIAGRHIDRAAERTNPMYGAQNPPDGQTELGDSETQGNAHWGHRTQGDDGSWDAEAAWLTDGPSLNAAGQTSTQQFETTALCLEGDMSGTYLGSVSWGYEKDTSDTITLLPLSLVSMGVPTSSWMAAAGKWNDTTTDVGGTDEDNLQLPTTDHQNEAVSYTNAGLSMRIFQLRDQLDGMTESEDPTTYRNVRFEVRALERELQRRQDAGEGSSESEETSAAS